MVAKIVNFVKAYHSEIVTGIAVLCITIISFNIGRSYGSVPAKSNLAVIAPQAAGQGSSTSSIAPKTSQAPRDPRVVASKAAGSKLYHFTWCSGAQRIAEKNKLTFATEAAAIAAGYTLASNCQK